MNPFHPFGDIIDPTTGRPVRILHQPRPIGDGPIVLPPNGYLLIDAPRGGAVNVASEEFRLTPEQPYTGTVTLFALKLESGDEAGGTFTPSELTWDGDNSTKTFTYTPSVVGEIIIDATIDPDLPYLRVSYVSGSTGASQTFSTAFADIASECAELTASQFIGSVPFSDRNTCYQNWCLRHRYANREEITAMKAMLALP